MSNKEAGLSRMVDLRKDITNLRNALKDARKNKEDLFGEKSSISKEIIEKIGKIKDLKRKRDARTKEVRKLKEERSKTNALLKEKSDKLRIARDDQKTLSKEKEIKFDPIKLKEKIEFLEMKIQTEALPFSKEKSIMKTINDLQKKYKELEGFTGLLENVKKCSKEFRDAKTLADKVHREIIDKARESQQLHEQMVVLSKEVDDLKEKEKSQLGVSTDAKDEYRKVNDVLKEKVNELNRLSRDVGREKEKKKIEKKKAEEKTLKEKGKEVAEKIKTRKKLTTEDLLIFQSVGTNEDLRTDDEYGVKSVKDKSEEKEEDKEKSSEEKEDKSEKKVDKNEDEDKSSKADKKSSKNSKSDISKEV